jgi:hypothetical protein
MMCISVTGGKQHQRSSVAIAADWFAGIAMPDSDRVVVEVRIQNLTDSWGWVSEGDGSVYLVSLERNQGLRSMLRTLMHELLHVRQYERGTWGGDGEREAEASEVLADAVWISGLI